MANSATLARQVGGADLQRVHHSRPVTFEQDVVREPVALIELHERVGSELAFKSVEVRSETVESRFRAGPGLECRAVQAVAKMPASTRHPIDMPLERRLRHDHIREARGLGAECRKGEGTRSHGGVALGQHALDLRRANQPSVPGVTTKQLISTFSSDHHRHVPASQLGDGVQRDHRRVGERLVQPAEHSREPDGRHQPDR